MITHAFEVPVVGGALLLAVGLADRAVHVENQFLQGQLAHGVDPLAGGVLSSRASHIREIQADAIGGIT
jgi:hypothetical protein